MYPFSVQRAATGPSLELKCQQSLPGVLYPALDMFPAPRTGDFKDFSATKTPVPDSRWIGIPKVNITFPTHSHPVEVFDNVGNTCEMEPFPLEYGTRGCRRVHPEGSCHLPYWKRITKYCFRISIYIYYHNQPQFRRSLGNTNERVLLGNIVESAVCLV